MREFERRRRVRRGGAHAHADADPEPDGDADRRRRRRFRPAADPRRRARACAVGVTEFNAEPGRQPRAAPAARAVGRGARRARRDQARVLPARDRLGLGAAVRGRARRTSSAPHARLHARDRAVPRLGRRARPAAGARLAPARGRLAGARRARDDARLGGRAAGGLRAAGHARPQPAAARRRAGRLPAADRRRARRPRSRRAPTCASGAPGTSRTTRAFISPQRAACDREAPSPAPAAYAELTRTLIQALDEAPGDQQIVLGETAGLPEVHAATRPPSRSSSTACRRTSCAPRPSGPSTPTSAATTRWRPPRRRSRRAAARSRTRSGSPRPASAPRRRTCPPPTRSPTPRRAASALHDRLVQWFNDPRVTVAFQYTVREDDKFPTGLFSTDLSTPRLDPQRVDRVGRRARSTRAAAPVRLLKPT